MKKVIFIFFSYCISIGYGQTVIKKMENVRYNYVTEKSFLLFKQSDKKLNYLEYFKATDAKTSLLVFYGMPKDSIKIINGGKTIKENRFTQNSTSVRSIQPITNQKGLEIIFYRTTGIEKIDISAEDLKKYKFLYISPKQTPIELEFTNIWKLFI